jgi:hypothetical protein
MLPDSETSGSRSSGRRCRRREDLAQVDLAVARRRVADLEAADERNPTLPSTAASGIPAPCAAGSDVGPAPRDRPVRSLIPAPVPAPARPRSGTAPARQPSIDVRLRLRDSQRRSSLRTARPRSPRRRPEGQQVHVVAADQAVDAGRGHVGRDAVPPQGVADLRGDGLASGSLNVVARNCNSSWMPSRSPTGGRRRGAVARACPQLPTNETPYP